MMQNTQMLRITWTSDLFLKIFKKAEVLKMVKVNWNLQSKSVTVWIYFIEDIKKIVFVYK